MQYRNALLIILALALILGATGVATAQLASSPWPTLGGDLGRTNVYADTGIAQPAGYWQFVPPSAPTEDYRPTTAASVGTDGTIYVGVSNLDGDSTTAKVYALNPDGTVKWVSATIENAIYGTPTVSTESSVDYIYVGAGYAAGWGSDDPVTINGAVYKLDSADGDVIWVFDEDDWEEPLLPIYTSPVVDDSGYVYVGAGAAALARSTARTRLPGLSTGAKIPRALWSPHPRSRRAGSGSMSPRPMGVGAPSPTATCMRMM
jgi:outer membrane protein assembly factor BamB